MNIVDIALAAVDPLNNMNPTVVNRAEQAAEVAQYLYDNFGADIIRIDISKHAPSSIHVVEHPFLRDLGPVTITPHHDRIKLSVTYRGVKVFCLAKEYK